MEVEELCDRNAIVVCKDFIAIKESGFNGPRDVKHESHGRQLSRLAKLGRAKVTHNSQTIFLFYLREGDSDSPIKKLLLERGCTPLKDRPSPTLLQTTVKQIKENLSTLVGPRTFAGTPADSPSRTPAGRISRRRGAKNQKSQPGTPNSSSNSYEFSPSPSVNFTPHSTPSYTGASYSAPGTPYDPSSVAESPRSDVSFSPFNFLAAAMRLPGTPPQAPCPEVQQTHVFVPQPEVMMTRVNNTSVMLRPHPPQRRVIPLKRSFGPKTPVNAKRQLTFDGATGAAPHVLGLPSSPINEPVQVMELVTGRANLDNPFDMESCRHHPARCTACGNVRHAHWNELDAQQLGAEYTSAGANIEYTGQWAIDIFSPPMDNVIHVPTSRSNFWSSCAEDKLRS